MTSASCTQPARTVRSSGWDQLRSSITVLVLIVLVISAGLIIWHTGYLAGGLRNFGADIVQQQVELEGGEVAVMAAAR